MSSRIQKARDAKRVRNSIRNKSLSLDQCIKHIFQIGIWASNLYLQLRQSASNHYSTRIQKHKPIAGSLRVSQLMD